MTRSEEEKIAFGKRMTDLLIDNGFTKLGRGDLKGVVVPNYTSFASAYSEKTGENLSYKAVENWCKGGAYFETKRYAAISEMLNASSEWIVSGKGTREGSNAVRVNIIHEPEPSDSIGLNSSALGDPDIPQFINIPIYDVELAAGNGGYSAGDHSIGSVPVSTDCLSRNNIYPPEASIVKVRGDSMDSTLKHGDTILIDTGAKKLTSNGIFAFEFEDELRVKRFTKQLDGIWRIISDNDDKNIYRDEMLSNYDINSLKIIGKVVTILERSLI
jgi:phage repressor protein C with HTH and peptisase S24 domain